MALLGGNRLSVGLGGRTSSGAESGELPASSGRREAVP